MLMGGTQVWLASAEAVAQADSDCVWVGGPAGLPSTTISSRDALSERPLSLMAPRKKVTSSLSPPSTTGRVVSRVGPAQAIGPVVMAAAAAAHRTTRSRLGLLLMGLDSRRGAATA